jgi:hypothetical protein
VDRRDNIVLGSTVSDFYVEFIGGVAPEDIDPKTYPYVSLDCSLLPLFADYLFSEYTL